MYKAMYVVGHLPYQLVRISSIITILKSKDLDIVVRAIEKFARLGTSSKVSWKKKWIMDYQIHSDAAEQIWMLFGDVFFKQLLGSQVLRQMQIGMFERHADDQANICSL